MAECAVQSHQDTLRRLEAESEILRSEVKRRRWAELNCDRYKAVLEHIPRLPCMQKPNYQATNADLLEIVGLVMDALREGEKHNTKG